MKKIKKLELRTGQELNSLQQSFVVGGHVHNWVKVNGCNCRYVGDSHIEKCLNTQTTWDPTVSGIIGGVVSVVSGNFSGIGSTVSGLLNCKTITCYREMELVYAGTKTHSSVKEWDEAQ